MEISFDEEVLVENMNNLKKALDMETERVIDLKSHVSNEVF